jgi:FMN phosphatase YigB (HAD superfamily)
MINEKLILTDCDGVLLHWEWSFDRWMSNHGYVKHSEGAYDIDKCYNINRTKAEELVKMFNETVFVTNLPPYRDAIKYVRKLHEEHGYVFHVITSIGDEPEIVEGRVRNLHNVFGVSPFYRITCLDPSVSKASVLKQYAGSGCVWIEDHLSNFHLGNDLGLNSILVDQHYNRTFDTDSRVRTWREIYKEITS